VGVAARTLGLPEHGSQARKERREESRRGPHECVRHVTLALMGLSVARNTYEAELALLTCSAVSPEILNELKLGAGFPVLKIDGLITSFPPTSATARALLSEASTRAGRSIEIVEEQAPVALKALLAGTRRRTTSCWPRFPCPCFEPGLKPQRRKLCARAAPHD